MSNIYYQRPNNSGKKTNNQVTHNDINQHDNYYQPNYQPHYQAHQYRTNRTIVNRTQSAGKDLIANIVLVLLSITLVIAILTAISEMRYISRDDGKDANSFWWYYESGSYVDNIKYMYENKARGIKETPELTQCYSVAEYFEAASLYKAAVFLGDTDKEQKYQEIMEKAYSEMGDVSYLAEDIDDKLGIRDIIK